MKKAFLLLACGILAVCSCRKDDVPVPAPDDSKLAGTAIDVSAFSASFSKIFVLNEGGMGSNNSSLDFLRSSNGNYVTGAFRKMNPDAGAGLGDVGNDIALAGDELWMVINNSGIVEVVSAENETEIAAIKIPTPRNIAFDDNYAYVSSWAGAYANGAYDENYIYKVTDYYNPKGCVYRINLKTKKVEGSVEVGYQPEGLACYGEKLFVANSGGIACQLPPDYSYDNTVSIIDTGSFKLAGTQEVEVNLKNVWSDGAGTIFVSTLGNYYDIHSGVFAMPAGDPSKVSRVGTGSAFIEDLLHVSCAYMLGGRLYCIGTADEFDWISLHTYNVWSVSVNSSTGAASITQYPIELSGTPYGMAVVDAGAGCHCLLVGDAGDYFNPGSVSCYQLDYNDNDRLWSVTAGVCPGHFAVK
ncbi:MAG: hypothetical protein IJS66_07695 [Bacteroidales bacterium]|nr:hypothetical protein [Bacteroidales bacterium]